MIVILVYCLLHEDFPRNKNTFKIYEARVFPLSTSKETLQRRTMHTRLKFTNIFSF